MAARGGWGRRDATGAGASNLFEYEATELGEGEDAGVKSLQKDCADDAWWGLGNVVGRE